MEIKGKVHCFFEQSGVFKNEFIKLGIPAEDYDIQDNFGQTDHNIDLFAEIEKAYGGGTSIFDSITCDDLIMAFFPCIYFCDLSTLNMRVGTRIAQGMSIKDAYAKVIEHHHERDYFFGLLQKMFCVAHVRGLRLIFENPYNGQTYLKQVLRNPDIFDHNRMLRGDWFVKPTGYWYLNCEPTRGCTEQNDKKQKLVWKKNKKKAESAEKRGIHDFAAASSKAGLCSEERSIISSDYARNFICDFILGKKQNIGQLSLF